MRFYEEYKNIIDREVLAAKYLGVSLLNLVLFNSNNKLKLRKVELREKLSGYLKLKYTKFD